MWDTIAREALNLVKEKPLAVGILVLFGLGSIWGFLTKKGRIRKAAKRIHDSTMGSLASELEIESVSPDGFKWLDLDWYEERAAEVEALGFHRAGDFELTNLSKATPATRTFVRALVAAHGQIVVGIWHVKLRGWGGWLGRLFKQQVEFRTVDIETGLSDGTFVLTTNVTREDKLAPPPQILKERHPQESSAAQLHAAHVAHVQRTMAARPGVQPVTVGNVAQLLDFQRRFHALQQAHRQQVGGLAAEELDRFMEDTPEELRRDIAAEVERLRQANKADVSLSS